MERRVVVTGLGLITAVGNDVSSTWEALLSGVSGGATITRFDPEDLPVRFACEVKDFDPAEYLDRKEIKRTDRFCQFALAASDQAMQDAGFNGSRPETDANRFGVVTGSGIGGIATLEEQHQVMLDRGPGRVSPFFVPMFIADMAPGLISMRYDARGPNYTTVSACASSAHAVGNAFRLIRNGDADVLITGGAESTVTPLTMAGFAAMKALSTRNDEPERASRPFDANRDGFVLGEGCGMMILEELEFARARGADILAEVIGFGQTADAYHITAPSPDGEGAQRAMRLALEDARLDPERDRLHQRPRHVDATQRRDGDPGDQERVRRARRRPGGRLDEVDDRPHARGRRRRRGGDHGPGPAGGEDPADDQLQRGGPRLRPELRPQRDARAAGAGRALELLRVRRTQRQPGHETLGRVRACTRSSRTSA